MASGKKGPSRKSRMRRLPIARGSGEPPTFSPSSEAWAAIETAYGRTLDSNARDAIAAIMNSFLFWVSNETGAPFLKDALQWLDGIKRQADNLHKALLRPAPGLKQDAALYAETRIYQAFNSLHSKDQHIGIDGLLSLTISIGAACHIARKDLADGGAVGFVEGTQWAAMVRSLTTFAEERGLPTGAPKDSDKRTTSPPFVSLVMELMKFVPEAVRRHSQSWQACAQAISQARKEKPKRELTSQQQGR